MRFMPKKIRKNENKKNDIVPCIVFLSFQIIKLIGLLTLEPTYAARGSANAKIDKQMMTNSLYRQKNNDIIT